ncbi:MAG TPA: hypothetical protein VE990_12115, partial [Acidimicrobiales bacterium]|nr:hypothetical protein [Acidimicrobiales bacterium]
MSRATKKPAPLSTGKTGLTLALASGTGGRVELVEVGVGEVVDVDDEVVEAGGLVVRTGANVVRTGVVVVVGWVVVVLDEVVVVD